MAKTSIVLLLALAISSANTLSIGHRDSTCPAKYDQCKGAGLPSNFCCPSASTCISLDNASSAICCPKGQDCTRIEPISCDMKLHSAELFPLNAFKTTKLNCKLTKCRNSCCPFGYACHSGTCVLIEKTSTRLTTAADSTRPASTMSATSKTSKHSAGTSSTAPSTQSQTPSVLTTSMSTSPSTSTSTSTTVDTTSKTSTLTPTHTPSTSALAGLSPASALNATTPTCPSFPGKAIVAGFFPGLFAGLLLAAVIFFIHRKRQSARSSSTPSSSFGSLPLKRPPSNGSTNGNGSGNSNSSARGLGLGLEISEPIPSNETSYRTDFLLQSRARSGPSRSRSVLQRTGSRVRSLFSATSASPSASASASTNTTSRELDAEKPPPVPSIPALVVPGKAKQRQPGRQSELEGEGLGLGRRPLTRSREPSTESIRVYSPGFLTPKTYQNQPVRPGTRFEDMMERVGVGTQGHDGFGAAAGSGSGSGSGSRTRQQVPPGGSPLRIRRDA